ncbi:hypothetical protein [Joostella sp. CR20]|uniref:hypothetical protein n=1 Tax=Joostella sp. CR20 TaxID=2804312 RepID=UPI00313E699A
MKNLKNKPFSISVCLFFIAFGLYAQKQSKTFKESFDVQKNAVVEVNTSYADVTFDTWNKDKVEVEAIIEIENVSKEEAEKYFKAWGFKAEGNSSKVRITTNNGVRWTSGNRVVVISDDENFNFSFPDSIPMPPIPPMPPLPPMDSLVVMAPVPPMPPLPFNFDEMSFDYEAYQKNGDAYLKEWKKKFNESFNDDVKANLESWQKEVKAQQKEWQLSRKEIMEASREAREASIEARKASTEARKAMNEARREMIKIRTSTAPGSHQMYYFNSEGNDNLKVKKTIKIKIPKGVKLKMDVRHGEVSLAENTSNINATLSYSRLHAFNVDGDASVIKASYSPVLVDNWNKGELMVNYTDVVTLKQVNSIKLTSKSSNVAIQNFSGDALVEGSFGNLAIERIADDFNTLNILLDNSEAQLTLPKTAFNFYSNASNSMMKYPKALVLNVSKHYGSEVANGFYGQKNSNKTINLVATFSDVSLK